MMSRHFGLNLEFTGAIAKRLPHAKNQLLGLTVSSINSLQIYIHTYTNINRVLIVRIYQESYNGS